MLATEQGPAAIIRTEARDYALEETGIIRRGRELFEECTQSEEEQVQDEEVIVGEAGVVTVKAAHVNNEGLVVGVGETVVDASVEACLAHVFAKEDLESSTAAEGKSEDFDRSTEIEDTRQLGTAERIKLANKYRGGDFASHFADKSGKKVNKVFPLVKSWTKIEGIGKGWGKTVLNVRAALEEVAAFIWDFDSQACIDISDDVERSVLEEEREEFEKVVRRRGHDSFEFVFKMFLHVISDDHIIIIAETAESVEESGEYRRASESFAIKLLRRGDLETKVEFVTEIGLSGETGRSNSSKAALRNLLERRLNEFTMTKLLFQYKVELVDMTEKDGEALAHAMLWDDRQLSPGRSKAVQAEEIITKSRALSSLKAKYPWIVVLIQRAREGAVAVNRPVLSDLDCLKEEEARTIGNNLMSALKRHKRAEAGIDVWRGQNKAVDELLTEYPWMQGLFLALGQGVLNAASWGLRWR